MNTRRTWSSMALAAALLAACGGGDTIIPGSGLPAGAPTTKGAFASVVSFGDSLSDLGAYAPATSLAGNGSAPYLGGKYTNNSATSTIWVENVAASLGLVITPHEVGFAGQSVKCPVAAVNAALAGTCTGYGQAGSRVTDANGYGKANGALTVPMKTQVANHLARFGSFKGSDLIFVWFGGNESLVQFEAFAIKAGQIQADAAAGKYTADQASGLLLNAQLEAQGAMKQAALDLGSYVRTEILGKGGKYVVVLNLPDWADTPFGASLPPTIRPVMTALGEIFNLWLREALTGQPVQHLDFWSLMKDIKTGPAKYGLANVTIPTCDEAKISVFTGGRETGGSSLFCNSTPGVPYNGLRAGADVNTWLFADSGHPTTGGHKVVSDEVLRQLRAFGWI